MLKIKLNDAVEICHTQTKDALQTIYDALNHSQQTQIVKDENVLALFD